MPIKNNSVKEKLRHLLHFSDKHSITDCVSHDENGQYLDLNPEILKLLGPSSKLDDRLHAIESLMTDVLPSKRLSKRAIELLWLHVQDFLLERNLASETCSDNTDAVVKCLTAVCRYQPTANLTMCRVAFFNVLRTISYSPSGSLKGNVDLELCTQYLAALTDNGRLIDDFETEVVHILKLYVSHVLSSQNYASKVVSTLICILYNITGINFDACIAEWSALDILDNVSQLSTALLKVMKYQDVVGCMEILDNILCSGCSLDENLQPFVELLAVQVNEAAVCQETWKTARKLIGGNSGHSVIRSLCNILCSDEAKHRNSTLTRGCVFFICMSMWGSQRVFNLRNSPSSVLHALRKAVKKFPYDSQVLMEILLGIQRLVQKYGRDLHSITWDCVLNILSDFYAYNALSSTSQEKKIQNMTPLFETFHDILTTIENYYDRNEFSGSLEHLFSVVAQCGDSRSERSTFALITYYLRYKISSPYKNENCIENLRHLVNQFYRINRAAGTLERTNIRLYVIKIIDEFYAHFALFQGEKILDSLIIVMFEELPLESNTEVQRAALEFLVRLLQNSDADAFTRLLKIIEKCLCQAIKDICIGKELESNQRKSKNVLCCISDLIAVLKHKWDKYNCASCCSLLIDVLYECIALRYEQNTQCNDEDMRNSIFLVLKLFLSFGSTYGSSRVGYRYDDDKWIQNRFIECRIVKETQNVDDCKSVLGYSSKQCFDISTLILEHEQDFAVIQLLAELMPSFLQSRQFVLSFKFGLLKFVTILLDYLKTFDLKTDSKSQHEDSVSSSDTLKTFTRTLVGLTSYCSLFSDDLKRKLVGILLIGLHSDSSLGSEFLVPILICLFEIPNMIDETLHVLLYRMTRLNPTPILGISTLEFLVSLMRMPDQLSKFQLEQFRLVFDLILQYTDSFKFTEAIVCLAYQVFFRFFLQVSPSLRCKIARYVTKQLIKLENNPRIAEGSSDSKYAGNSFSLHNSARKILILFLVHFAFQDGALLSQDRSSTVNSILSPKPAQHFIIGDNIISITTCGGSEFENCQQCRTKKEKNPGPTVVDCIDDKHRKINSLADKRRRYKSAVQMPTANHTAKVEHQIARKSLDDNAINKSDLYSIDNDSILKASPYTCWCRGHAQICLRHAFGVERWTVKDETLSKSCSTDQLFDRIGNILDMSIGDLFDGLHSHDNSVEKPDVDAVCSAPGNENLFNAVSSIEAPLKPSHITKDQLKINFKEATGAKRFLLKLLTYFYTINPATIVTSASVSSIDNNQRSSEDCNYPAPAMVSSVIPRFSAVYYLPNRDATDRSLKLLDMIRPQEVMKVGVLYVGPDQSSEHEILGNPCGSLRYDRFLNGLGNVISLSDVDQDIIYLGGLSTDGTDGLFAYYWSDQITQVIFHVSTLMPNKADDPLYVDKKRHIGNNHVSIVFNDSGADYELHTITGQFTYVAVIVDPLDDGMLRVRLKAKGEISKWLALKEAVLSDEKMPLLCRQMALRAELFSRIWLGRSMGCDVYVSNSVERLKQIRHIKERYCGPEFTLSNAFETNVF